MLKLTMGRAEPLKKIFFENYEKWPLLTNA